jgi:hypothetical protein
LIVSLGEHITSQKHGSKLVSFELPNPARGLGVREVTLLWIMKLMFKIRVIFQEPCPGINAKRLAALRAQKIGFYQRLRRGRRASTGTLAENLKKDDVEGD